MPRIILYCLALPERPFSLIVDDPDNAIVEDIQTLAYNQFQLEFRRLQIGLSQIQVFLAPLDLTLDPRKTLHDRVQNFLRSEDIVPQDLFAPLSELLDPQTLNRKHVNFILQIAGPEEEAGDGLGILPMFKARELAQAAAKDTVAPSSISRVPKTYREEQNRHPIYNGRGGRFGPSIGLYQSAFVAFAEQMKRLDEVDVTDATEEELTSIAELMKISSEIYDKDDERVYPVAVELSKLFGVEIERKPLKESSRTADGCVDLKLRQGFEKGVLLYHEGKPEVGVDGDPGLQASLTYRDHVYQRLYTEIRNASSCPCVILALAGPHLCVLGAVLTPVPVIEPLTDYMYLGMGPRNQAQALNLVRFFRALRVLVKSLQNYYATLTPSPIPDDAALFPHPTFLPTISLADKALVDRLEYKSWFAYEGKPSDDYRRALYRGQLDGRPVVIKFCESYCADAHRLLAEAGLAPALHLCTAVVGGFQMVVMDYVEGETAYRRFRKYNAGKQKYFDGVVPEGICGDVERAISLLHDAGFVYGDLRRPNILVTSKDGAEKNGAMLIDFDWAGRAGQTRYPLLINKSEEIVWADGVMAGGEIKPQHDRDMLRCLGREYVPPDQ